jgi:hypothetical protein
MSDDDDNDDLGSSNGGIIGAILSVLLLLTIWPYLLALLGILITYLFALAMLAWITEHWILALEFLAIVLAIYYIYRSRLIANAWDYVFEPVQAITNEKSSEHKSSILAREFIPSTNLYCYSCIKKLGIQSFEINHQFYCKDCSIKITDYE